jgi:Transcriptional regulators containing a DNA-binding HTH domain and an aminotransferase domain (MocR family) and their eukaryotic orthologs
MLTYSFENTNDNLYEHLYKCIRDDILSGTLPPDYKLPSKRSFAKNLSVSTITVENAYNQLLSEGFIYSLPRKGFFVSEIFANSAAPFSSSRSYPAMVSASRNNPDSISTSHNNPDSISDTFHDVTKSHNPSPLIADFTSNYTSPDSFPFSTWAKLTRQILSDSQERLMTNSPSNGTLELRSAIAEYLNGFRNITTSPDNIIIGAGTEYLYTILMQLLGSNMVYATENPGYRKLSMILDMVGLNHIDIPVDSQGISVEKLEDSPATIVHVTPSHHFPTGITMPVRRRYELLNWASKDHYILEDDYDSEFRLSGRPIPSLFSMDTTGNVIYMNTFTKTLSSTIRISYMVLPDKLAKLYHKKLSFYSCTVSNFEQLTLARFINEGFFEKHINRMRTAYRKKRDHILNVIKTGPMAGKAEIKEANAGLHFILKLDTKYKDNELTDKLIKHGIKIYPLSYYGNNEAHSFVVNYSSVPEAKMEEAINVISDNL